MKASQLIMSALVAGAALSGVALNVVFADDVVAPESVAIVSLRGESVATISPTEFYRGASLLLTNCVLYAGTSTNAARQGLGGVAIEVRVGTIEDNTDYAGLVADTNGLWYCTVAVPTNMQSAFIQVKLTDGGTNTYIYPWKSLFTRQPLSD